MAAIRRFGSTKAACPAGKRPEATPSVRPRRRRTSTPPPTTSATVPTISASATERGVTRRLPREPRTRPAQHAGAEQARPEQVRRGAREVGPERRRPRSGARARAPARAAPRSARRRARRGPRRNRADSRNRRPPRRRRGRLRAHRRGLSSERLAFTGNSASLRRKIVEMSSSPWPCSIRSPVLRERRLDDGERGTMASRHVVADASGPSRGGGRETPRDSRRAPCWARDARSTSSSPRPCPASRSAASSGRPSALANAIASATAWMIPAHMIWFVALAAWPAPLSPRRVAVRPIAANTGATRSKAGLGPPTMIASVPSRAPSTPPLTGASRNVDVARRDAARGLPRRAGGDGRAVDDDRAGAQPREHRVDDGEHIGVGRDAEHDACRSARRALRGQGRGDAELGRDPAARTACGSRRRPAGRHGGDCAPCRGPWRPGRRTPPPAARSPLVTELFIVCRAFSRASSISADVR